MKISYVKIRLFFKSVLHAVLGISTEVLFAAGFIAAGFAVCALLWAIFR